MANVTQTFTKSETWSNKSASAHYAYVREVSTVDWAGYTIYNIVPDTNTSGDLLIELNLPANVVVQSVDFSRRVSSEGHTSFTTNWVELPDIEGTGSINDRIKEYINQEHPSSIRVRLFYGFRQQEYKDVWPYDGYDSWKLNGVSISSLLKSCTVSLIVTYEQAQNNGTVSYGVNNAYQKCNVYYGTGNEWKKCKAYYGSGGQWVECK